MHDKESLAQSIAGAGTQNNIPSMTAVLEAKGERRRLAKSQHVPIIILCSILFLKYTHMFTSFTTFSNFYLFH